MSRTVKLTLLAIAVFVALMLGSFVWFVATWDAEREEPVTQRIPAQTAPDRGQT